MVMEKKNHTQLELFSQIKDYYTDTRSQSSRSFWTFMRDYEKTVLIIIGMVIIGIVSFSLGVERGKRLALIKASPAFDIALNALPEAKPLNDQVTKQVQLQTASLPERQNIIELAKPIETAGGYTIQLASYKTRKFAQKEAQDLKKKGYVTFIIPKGSYLILCVGNFSTKDKARTLLAQIQQKYRGCYIRRL